MSSFPVCDFFSEVSGLICTFCTVIYVFFFNLRLTEEMNTNINCWAVLNCELIRLGWTEVVRTVLIFVELAYLISQSKLTGEQTNNLCVKHKWDRVEKGSTVLPHTQR